jgi:hypothetical protein
MMEFLDFVFNMIAQSILVLRKTLRGSKTHQRVKPPAREKAGWARKRHISLFWREKTNNLCVKDNLKLK